MANLSREEFITCCERLLKYNNTSILWAMQVDNTFEYISGKYAKNNEENIEQIMDTADINMNNVDENEIIVLGNQAKVFFDFSIVYNESYQNPVLYFNIYENDGKLFSLEKVWNMMPKYFKEFDKWSFITQAEHPCLSIPFFQIHPCHTDKLMEPLVKLNKQNSDFNYLLSWLSIVLSVLGINY